MLNNYDEYDPQMVQTPEWMNIRQQQPPAKGGFIEMLKKRMNHPQMKDGEEGMAAGKAAVAGGEGSAPVSL